MITKESCCPSAMNGHCKLDNLGFVRIVFAFGDPDRSLINFERELLLFSLNESSYFWRLHSDKGLLSEPFQKKLAG